MARKLLKDTCTLAAEILDGNHDADLDYIVQAAAARKKAMFRKGSKVRLTGTKNPGLDGKVGTVIRCNPKTVAVGVGEATTGIYGTTYDGGEYNVPLHMLEPVAVAVAGLAS